MITKEKIARINFLARKAKEPCGLTDEEKREQQLLRREYIDAFKADTLRALREVEIKNPDGTIEPLIKQ